MQFRDAVLAQHAKGPGFDIQPCGNAVAGRDILSSALERPETKAREACLILVQLFSKKESQT